jgi:hypothetical protein
MDYSSFKTPFIPLEQVRTKADEFRVQYSPTTSVPIEIHDIIEFDLGLEIRPVHSLSESADIDALLLGTLQTIVVDSKMYMDDRMQNRLRFSLAHEVGHLVLHRDIYEKISHSSIDGWLDFFRTVPDDEYMWIEQHAYEFAGRLLVPPALLKNEYDSRKSRAEAMGFSKWDESGETTLEYVSDDIARKFGVSSQVISKRLLKEKIHES